MKSALHLVVRGRVQGVFYRGWTAETAVALGLDGWVRNRRDGTVEILLAGEEAALGRMIERCREGPLAARVAAVEIEASKEAVAPGFVQRPTL